MAVALEKFIKQLEDSGIIAPGKLENFVPPKAHPKDAEELARQLIKADHLTPFQAQHVVLGKAKALILGNYTILDKIGAGGMGHVFRAEHRRMERVVAIKMLPQSMTKDAAAVARFQREVKAAAKLRHPNIVAADDADEANGAHFLVMEYVEGKDLSAHVKKNGRFSVEKAVNYILQAARGLEFAHNKGVVHRDIKPANLLLSSDGTVKILDMGLARIDAAGGNVAAQAELTGTGAIMGTVDYMAPEQGVSTKDADARADIYSLGCSLHYLLIGKPVYGGESVGAKFLAHHNQPIPDLCALRDDVPQQVNAIFRKMVAKKVEDRYQTMTDVIAELQACGVGHDQSLTMQRSLSSNLENSALTFLKNMPADTTHKPKPTKKATSANTGNGRKKLIYGAVGAGLLGVLVLAGIIVSLKTKDGTLIVEVNQPDAMVQVLDEQGKVEVSQKGGVGKVTIGVDPGKHRLKVEKDGFTVFGESFEIASGGKMAITAKLVPVKVVAKAAQPKQPWNTPAFQQWMKTVAAMLAEQQVEAVSKKLMELNAGFDGKVTPRIENGVVTELKVISPSVVDLSPVRALGGLKVLHNYAGSGATSRFSDLSPLQGMRLSELRFDGAIVSDLSALRGMPLMTLHCSYTPISDLSPLKAMPLTDLDCHNTKVSDLSPLQGMRLSNLDLGNDALVTDLSPLEGMPLTTLSISQTSVSDLSPLRGMSLSYVLFTPKNITKALNVIRQMGSLTTIGTGGYDKSSPAEFWKKYDAGEFGKPAPTKPLTNINDPAFQAWMKTVAALPAEKQIEAVGKKLMELNPGFDGNLTDFGAMGTPKIENGVVRELGFITNNVTDISPVRALAGLKLLSCNGNNIGGAGNGRLFDLSPLRDIPLTALTCSYTLVSDLSPLQGMPLTNLSCYLTKVSNLSPLQGMRLNRLQCSSTPISDLSPLQGMPLANLFCNSTQVSDLSPLMSLTTLDTLEVKGTKVTAADIAALHKALPNCKIEWDGLAKPITSFSNPAFQAWMKTVAALPAEKQVEAVSKKLTELNSGFDGKFAGIGYKHTGPPRIENGVVTELGLVADDVTDISPLRALPGLKTLRCDGLGGDQMAPFSDLSPLHGMHLENLICYSTQVADLSPLQGMPLIELNCSHTQVADLSPLSGMKVTKLYCDSTKVSDLSPLRAMPPTILYFANTPVSDLSALQGMNLIEVSFTPKNITKGMDALRQPILFTIPVAGARWGGRYGNKHGGAIPAPYPTIDKQADVGGEDQIVSWSFTHHLR